MAKFHQYAANLFVLDDYVPYRMEVVRYLDLIRTTHTGRTLLTFIANNAKHKRVDIRPYVPTREAPVNATTEPDWEPDGYTKMAPVMVPVEINRTTVMLPSFERGRRFGTGFGANVTLHYHPANFRQYVKNMRWIPPGSGPGEVLFHELIHAMRMAWGRVLDSNVLEDLHMDGFEEFCAILAANMYRSERGFKLLRRDHAGSNPLPPDRADSASYYNFFEAQIQKWFASQKDFCLELAASPAKFNPLRYAADDLGLAVRTPMRLPP